VRYERAAVRPGGWNYLEHKDETDPAVYAGHYAPAHAEMIFDRVWRTIGDILAMLVNLHLPPGTSLVEIPPDQRNPVRPRRFHSMVQGLHPPAEGKKQA